MPQWPPDPHFLLNRDHPEISPLEVELWNGIHRAPDFVDAAPTGPSSGAGSTLPELVLVSDAVRLALDSEDKFLEAASHTAFLSIHQQLMGTIETSIEERQALDRVATLQSTLEASATQTAGTARAEFWPGGQHRGGWRTLRQRLGGWGWNLYRHAATRYALAVFVVMAAGLGGQQTGRSRGASALPGQTLVDDFQAELNTPTPWQYEARDGSPVAERKTAAWLSRHYGRRVVLPQTRRVGAKLLGARVHKVEGRPSVQTHYLKNGVRVALYQIHAPHYGLAGLHEVPWNKRSYFTQSYGSCRLVVWRHNDDIIALVTPMAMYESLQLAGSMRENSNDDDKPSDSDTFTEPA